MSRASGWIAAFEPHRGHYRFDDRVLPPILAQGTLMLEFTLVRDESGPLPLIHLEDRTAGWREFLSLGLDAQGRISLTQRRGDQVHAISLDARSEIMTGGRMRLSWRWDGPGRESLLTLKALDHGTLRQHSGHAPLPPTRAEAMALVAGDGRAKLGPRVSWLALGDHLHPLGPGACFAPATPIETPRGSRPAAHIRAGDEVLTADAGPQKVVWAGRVTLPALGHLRPVQLRAPVFGKTRDLWLLPQHRIALCGPSVDYILGEEKVLIEAHHLVDACTALQPDRPGLLSWQGILLGGHHLLIADGCEVESLHIGRLARQPLLAATTALAEIARAGELPLHRKPVLKIASGYEAATLAAARRHGRGPVAA
ncbi:Hint domain-containing protein [Thioclava sp.]|uniref:Hint domain-containing protein n=1 Tax=Thioclava sp. TaxID=1933450 RepID=UPI003AA882C4